MRRQFKCITSGFFHNQSLTDLFNLAHLHSSYISLANKGAALLFMAVRNKHQLRSMINVLMDEFTTASEVEDDLYWDLYNINRII